MTDSSQKFIARNRAPRVQIEYDVELYGAEKKVQLPFVMGVMSDLSGKSNVKPPIVEDRKFLEIDVDNFDSRMKAIAPRLAFQVPNTLTGEGNLPVDLTFEKMDDFSPAAIAAKIEPLAELLKARTQLSNLMAYMDGKAGAEALIEKILADPALLSALSDGLPDDADHTSALNSLRDAKLPETHADSSGSVLEALRDAAPAEASADTALDDALSSLPEVEDIAEEDSSADVLGDLAAAAPEEVLEDTALDDLLGNLAADAPEAPADSDLHDLLSDLDDLGAAVDAAADGAREDASADLDDLLSGLRDDEDGGSGLEDLLAGLDDDTDDADNTGEGDGLDDLESLMAGLDEDEAADPPDSGGGGDLDDLLAGLEGDASDDLDLNNLLESTGDAGESDLDALFADQGDEATADTEMADEELAFGEMSAARPEPQKLERRRFRIAIFGDFSARSARGLIETGDALAARKPNILDPDTVEDVIESFATTLVLPIGRDGAGIEVKLEELDDLHPDELFEKVELFEGLAGLKGQLSAGATAVKAARQLTAWGEEFGQAVVPPRKSSSGNTVRADLKLSDFQQLIGHTEVKPREATPLDDMLARIVGPHVRDIPNADTVAMQKAVDDALSGAMRLLLHHPEFQSVEAQWRTLDLIARSVEVDDTLDVVVYDVSAEEIAADLASVEDLASTGLVRLLTGEPMDEENGRGAYSTLVGLYKFEETPPHAELLGRLARVAAHVDAPFISAITPSYLDVKIEDRHPLVAQAWDMLRAMPEAGYLGLASPQFLLRRPYGAKSEPIYEFEFEEFTMSEGLSGMLWANPAVLVTILLARSFKENGLSMQLGKIMSLGDIPFHFVNDRYGDQVALPCTERNLTMDKHEHSVQRGYMPVLSIKGRNEIRLGSFNAVSGREILGPWSDAPAPPPSPAKPTPAPAPPSGSDDDADLDLDDLLADFADDTDDPVASGDGDGDGDDVDDALAALLADL